MKPTNQMKSNSATETMKRGEFLRSLGLSTGALMAFYCMGTGLTACSKSDSSDPTPTPTPTPVAGVTGNADTSKGAISFTIDLTNSNYSKLKTSGQYAIIGSLIVAKSKSGSFIALSKTCTHEGTEVKYRAAQDDIYCDNHGSEYSLTGAVDVGPATKPLTQYKTSLSADGNTLTVTA
ncbi:MULTISPECIES: ubiquinol-cytochrome c reductase iron-sulfur subunit [unclassified Spirosoma]|uniref:QcrA and Rieske domain-containing protein n=1 Tax=unclassified Spirosoma TaxID=2621999 RepID=UPI000ADCEFE8|nr:MULTISPECIES: Rieske 2Fe-2S domain-containing protein [unclassified Spirosoma]